MWVGVGATVTIASYYDELPESQYEAGDIQFTSVNVQFPK